MKRMIDDKQTHGRQVEPDTLFFFRYILVCPSERGDNSRAFSSWIISLTGGQTII